MPQASVSIMNIKNILIKYPIIIVLSALLTLLVLILTAYAQLEENFDSYNNGDLNDQGSWSGSAVYDVEDTIKQAGAKGVIGDCDGVSNYSIKKSFSGESDACQTFYMRNSALADGNGGDVLFYETNTAIAQVSIRASQYKYYDGAGFQVIGEFNTNTWQKLDVCWRSSDKLFKFRLDNGDWTDWDTTNASFTSEINAIALYCTNDSINYFDSFSIFEEEAPLPSLTGAYASSSEMEVYQFYTTLITNFLLAVLIGLTLFKK